MPYTIRSHVDTPFLIIYLIDKSGSMDTPDCGGKRRIEVVHTALKRSLRRMISWSRSGDDVRPRYAVGMIAYNNGVTDLTGGIKYIDQLEKFTIPDLVPTGGTNTAYAFQTAYEMLARFIDGIQDCPAPMICHLTDGFANDDNNRAEAQKWCDQIKGLKTVDGYALVENIFIGPRLLQEPILDAKAWVGVDDPNTLIHDAARALWYQSSEMPTSYEKQMRDTGYSFEAGRRMLIPAETPDMIELAFVAGTSTPRG